MENIDVYYEDIDFKLPKKNKTLSWIYRIIETNDKKCDQINFIFCNDNYLLKINQQYLKHDYYTDIITFNHSEAPTEISSDIYISIDRVKENALNFGIPFIEELHRVMAHGILHLLGKDDKTETEKIEMRKIEDHYLALRGL